jgi:hypothetical protein
VPETKSDSNVDQMRQGNGEQSGGEEVESAGEELFAVAFEINNDGLSWFSSQGSSTMQLSGRASANTEREYATTGFMSKTKHNQAKLCNRNLQLLAQCITFTAKFLAFAGGMAAPVVPPSPPRSALSLRLTRHTFPSENNAGLEKTECVLKKGNSASTWFQTEKVFKKTIIF